MALNELWFILVAVLFIGFFFLEGFDFGVGMAGRFLGKNDVERRIMINTIGPFWDANEVWLLTGGGAIFAAFPHWYATMFSGYYIPFVFVLLALIGRGVAFEFRGKVDHPSWKQTWDWIIFFGSILPPFLFGVLFSSILRGMPIDQSMTLHAEFSDYVNIYTVTGGVAVTLLCFLHGLLFLTLKTVGDLQMRARKLAQKMIYAVLAALVAFVGLSYTETDLFTYRGEVTVPLVALVVVSYGLVILFSKKGRDGWTFAMSGLGIALTVGAIFAGLFPRVMISSISSAYDLTIYNAASGAYSLKVMTIVAVTLLPFVLGYQIWSYYVFRKRVDGKDMVY
ncbi:cytochrome d ubiquinol oxidase subunit II [Anoxybacteroides rupiense]|uniref:Cytochrome d ubiquinol oxidase subunit II n=1 Tax=Anoxybacteroides rupiense TaxID=311460 RepID=A0ABD5IZE3_9BACL|nr:cytochrome d ubiquinol oxidase subunit II [Anoxybacillus rupiensis]MBB3909279.1 cytochrome d ubiquinol oxidase subunit II [Anoxybacillus rupiensis]MED5052999.1 cytochrome d ubiquinol oxidase subunit II [Anoxybacillus rupiensis]